MQVKLDALPAQLAKRIAPLYVVHGDEHLLAIEAADRIRAAARAAGYVEREILQVDRWFQWSRLTESGQSMSLFGDRKLIDLRIPGGKPGKEGSTTLQAYAKSLAGMSAAGDTVGLVTLPRLDGDARKSSWFSALQEAGVLIEAPLVDRDHLPRWLAGRLAAQGQEASDDALAFIVDRVEGNLLAAHQEVQKLGLLYPTGRLSFEQVRAAVLDVARFGVFRLGEAMLAGDATRVARMIEGLQDEGESPVLVHWAVTEEVRALLRGKLAVAAGQSLSSLTRVLRVWGAREPLFAPAVRRLSLTTLRTAFGRCAEIERLVKGLRSWQGPALADPWTELSRVALCIAGQELVPGPR